MPEPQSDEPRPFNPLEKRHLAESIVRFMEADRPCGALGSVETFDGAGVYAIYYSGDFPAYGPLREANRDGCRIPIYVGKAIPKGGRVGGWNFETSTGPVLSTRLRQHAESIRQTTNLSIEHFKERHLSIADVFIPLAENLLIEKYHPLWNVVVDGFGNKDVGDRRRQMAKSVWDELHPGRPTAAAGPCRLSHVQILDRIRRHLSGEAPVGVGPEGESDES